MSRICGSLCIWGLLRIWGLVLILIALPEVSAWAARPARVDVEEAPVYENLTPGSKIIRTLTRGTRIVVSNAQTEGFYKIRTNEGETGWVSAKGLQLLERPTPEQFKEWERKQNEIKAQAAERQKAADEAAWEEEDRNKKYTDFTFSPDPEQEEKRKIARRGPRQWTVLGFYGTANFQLGAIKSLTQLDIPTSGHQLGFELQYQHRKSWIPFVFRLESVGMKTDPFKDSVGNVYQMETSSTPLLLGVRFDVTERGTFSADLELLAGVSLNQKFTSISLAQTGANTTEMTATSFAAIFKGDITYQFAEDWLGYFELGYRSLRSNPATYSAASAAAAGSGVFTRNGSLVSVAIDLSGFFVSLGVGYSF